MVTEMVPVNRLRNSLVLLCTLIIVTPTILSSVNQFDVSEYIYGIDHDLQARARSAIEAERFTYRSRANRIQPTNTACRIRSERPCPPNKYRTPSGACNNVRHPAWGARGSPFLKLLPSSYSDGISRPRQSVGSHSLPTSSDIISNVLMSIPDVGSHEGLTSLSAVWSELVLQDIAATVHPVGPENECCIVSERRHPECYEMRDEEFGCKRYWRSVPSLTVYGCQFETREQMNGASAYLDGSGIYGVNDDKLHYLRTYEDGKVDLNARDIEGSRAGRSRA